MATFKRFSIAAGIIVGLVLSAGLLAAVGGDGLRPTKQAAADSSPATHSITVDGTGTVMATPDTADVTLGVQIQNAELATAQSQATTNMSAVIAALKQNGISDQNIKTVSYSIYPNQDPQKGTGDITSYTVTNLVDVKMTQLDKVGTVIDAAVSAGANNVGGIQFSVSNIDAVMQQARQQAMADAHSKAAQLAQLGGVTLGMPISITEGTVSTPQPFAASAVAADSSGSVPIQTGQNEVTVNVTVSYGF
ncbi:MAG TPA: SIMPL domain-containing protein [Nitrolancea sp.]|jgi:hypothetical protein|nr:SIMPL domain-containing protein [Nitrolancea sp.]